MSSRSYLFPMKIRQFRKYRDVFIPLAIILRRPRRGAPAALQLPKNSVRPLKILVRMPVVSLQFFMVRVRTIPVHACFTGIPCTGKDLFTTHAPIQLPIQLQGTWTGFIRSTADPASHKALPGV